MVEKWKEWKLKIEVEKKLRRVEIKIKDNDVIEMKVILKNKADTTASQE